MNCNTTHYRANSSSVPGDPTFGFAACLATARAVPDRLSQLDSKLPWDPIEPNSQKLFAFSVGANPIDFVLNGQREKIPRLFPWMKELAEKQADALLRALGEKSAVFELWPAYQEDGIATWVFARWKAHEKDEWQWLDEALWKEKLEPRPFLPVSLHTWIPEEKKRLVEGSDSLYGAPEFASGIWLDGQGEVVAGWPPTSDTATIEKLADEKYVVKTMPPPARQEEKPVTFVLEKTKQGADWKDVIRWDRVYFEKPAIAGAIPRLDFPTTFADRYRKDVEILSGAQTAKIGRRAYVFKRRNSGQPDHQLEILADYLGDRYLAMGLKIKRQSFKWRGTTQSNLIALIPGSLPPSRNRPVILADHYDTAIAEDTFEKTAKRESTPGADDNTTATATLLQAAEILKEAHPKHSIWLVHFTGEEFPGDCLGARHFFTKMLEEKQRFQALVLMDMIGFRRSGESLFQLNTGNSPQSLRLAGIALQAAAVTAPHWQAKLRTRFDPLSYLYNTDGWIADLIGLPVLFFNENLNRTNMEANPHYHQSTDLPQYLDWNYATSIAKTAILTAFALANDFDSFSNLKHQF